MSGDGAAVPRQSATMDTNADNSPAALLLVPIFLLACVANFYILRCASRWGILDDPAVAREERSVTKLDALPVVSWDAEAPIDGCEPTCALCLEPYVTGTCLRRLPCSHAFHLDCVDEWLKHRQQHKARTCPICKSDPLSPARCDDDASTVSSGSSSLPSSPVHGSSGTMRPAVSPIAVSPVRTGRQPPQPPINPTC